MNKGIKKLVSVVVKRAGAELRYGPHCIGPLYQPIRPIAKKATSEKGEE